MHTVAAKSRWLAPIFIVWVLVALGVSDRAVSATFDEGGGIGEISVVSNRADLISGGDALVSVDLLAEPASRSESSSTERTSTSAFAVRANGRFEGLVTGLEEGKNILRVRPGNGVGRWIEITNHPIGGPVFSGEQIQPWLCRTQLQGGTTPALGPSVDEKCNAAAPVVELFYRSTSNTVGRLQPGQPAGAGRDPADDDRPGQDGPVHHPARVTGTANRGIYQIAVLVDPTKPITPWSTEQPWNRKYVNTFGGACSVNYQQPTVGDVRNVARLGLGFAVGTSSLNTYANSCSDVISAEALMMTKEIITERWGPIRLHDRRRWLRRNDAAAHDLRRLPRAAERPHDEPALRGPLVPGRRLVRLPAAVPLLRAGRRRPLRPTPGWGDGSGNPLFPTPPRGSSSTARTRPIPTPSARRRSASPPPS